MSQQPFAGVTVLEFGHFVAVPYAGQLFADGGAHVIKVEPLEGEPSRHLAPLAPGESRHFLIRNRGKHSLPLDLKHPDAREILDALLARFCIPSSLLGLTQADLDTATNDQQPRCQQTDSTRTRSLIR